MEKDFKQAMVERLKKDCDVLISHKIPKALDNVNDEKGHGINTYRNLTKALAENIKLVEELTKEEYKPMWSIYKDYGLGMDEFDGVEGIDKIAVWMQNGNGERQNHQVFTIKDNVTVEKINGVDTVVVGENNGCTILDLEIYVNKEKRTTDATRSTIKGLEVLYNRMLGDIGGWLESKDISRVRQHLSTISEILDISQQIRNGVAKIPKKYQVYVGSSIIVGLDGECEITKNSMDRYITEFLMQ